MNGHDYVCDCQLKNLKKFLSANQNHAPNLKAILCADPIHRGKPLNSVPLGELKCLPTQFKITEDSKLEITENEILENPPFSVTDVVYLGENLENPVRFPLNPATRELKFPNLETGKYKVIISIF